MAEDGRNFVVQRTLQGGLSPNTDILKSRETFTWLDCQNLIVSNPTGYLSGISPKDSVTTPPPTRLSILNSYLVSVVNGPPLYGTQVWTKTIATFENAMFPSENWSFSGSGTASLTNAITEGNQALSCACTAGQTATASCTLPSSINLTSPTYSVLAIDSNWNNISNFSSGYIRVGSDSSNYRQYNLSSPGSTDTYVLKFNFSSPSSTTGSPVLSAIQYVSVSLTASGGGSITVKFDNLRLASFGNVSINDGTLTANASNVYTTFVLDSAVSTNSGISFISGDTLFLQTDTLTDGFSGLTAQTVKSGFKNTSPASNGTNFYLSQFQKSGSQNNNILYYVNGSDGYFSYDTNASAGSQHTRPDSTNYKYLCSHKNMMFLAGASSKPNVVQPSDVNDPATLTSANSVTVPDISGSYITGLISMDEYLAILRNDGIWKLYGSNPDSATTDFNLIRSEAKTGCLEQRAACRVGQYIYYFDGSDIYRWNGSTSENISSGMDTKLVQYNSKLVSVWFNPLRDLVIFNFVPSTVVDPVVTKTGYYQLAFCPTKNAWGEMGAFDDANSVDFWGFYWGGSKYTKPLNFTGGLSFYQVDPTTPTDISIPWFLKTQWNDASRPDIIKDHEQFTWYFRDQASRNTPSVQVDMYSDFDETDVAQTFQAQNEIQTITPNTPPDAGTFTITFGANTTSSLAYNASAATIQAALEALPSIGSGNIAVTGTLATLLTLTFQGTLAYTDVDPVTTTSSLTASAVNVTLAVNITQDGNKYVPTNNSMQLLCTGVSGRSVSSKISGTCTSQKDAAVMVSGYSYVWSEIEPQ